MLARLLAVALKHKLAALAVMLSVGGGGFVALAAASSPPAQGPTLQAASAGGSSAANPGPAAAASAPLGPPAGATASSPASVTGATPSSRAASPAATVSPLAIHAPAPSRPTTPGAASVAPASNVLPSLTAPAGVPSPSPAASCPSNQRLTDAEINWLLKQVSRTAAQNPSLSGGAATITGALEPLLGQNLCAAQAQPVVTTLCSNAGALQTINAMTAQLPFYVKPFVGNPCTDNLATVLPKLSSFSSLLG